MKVITDLFSKIKITSKQTSKSCHFCSRKTSDMRFFKNEENQKIKVCPLCVEYAERRAYRKF